MRLIDHTGDNRGVVPLEEALTLAQDSGMDLVEISPHADPPVCKILDHGKLKYEQQKKANVARKKQKVIDVKEIKMRPNIDDLPLLALSDSVNRLAQEATPPDGG